MKIEIQNTSHVEISFEKLFISNGNIMRQIEEKSEKLKINY